MHADMRRAYLDCHSFPIPCLPADTTNAELCDRIQLPELLQMAREGGNGTCLMFGQTGSGKTHSMAGIMEAAAALLFTRAFLPATTSTDTTQRVRATIRWQVARSEHCMDADVDLHPGMRGGIAVQRARRERRWRFMYQAFRWLAKTYLTCCLLARSWQSGKIPGVSSR